MNEGIDAHLHDECLTKLKEKFIMIRHFKGHFTHIVILGWCLLMGALPIFEQTALASPTISLEEPVHFFSPDEDPVVIEPGTYQVEAADAWLKLIPSGRSPIDAVLIQATRGTHEDEVATPQVLLTQSQDQPDLRQLVLSLPDGTGLEAMGSTTGVWPRGVAELLRLKQLRVPRATHVYVPPSVPVPPKICTQSKIDEVRGTSPATVNIDCQLNLTQANKITKSLIFEGASATGVTLNCNGATVGDGVNKDMIEVRSRKIGTDKWERPQNVTIKNCKIIGSIRVWGMGQNGEAPAIKESSRREATESMNHRNRVRNNAPKNIVFDNVTITGLGRNPFYLAPGVTYTELINSEINGKSSAVAIYLDAESGWNTIKNNYIHVSTAKREQVAVDGSAYNALINNRFSGLNHGGIYLYRNCGEGPQNTHGEGTIRHQTPQHNHIINNIFYYKKYEGSNPAVFLGSRNGNRNYCSDDSGFPYGSSASDKDYAQHNVVMQNQFYKRGVLKRVGLVEASISDYVKTSNSKVNYPNYIAHNKIVTSQTEEKNRRAGCYLPDASQNFLLHGQSLGILKETGNNACVTQSSCADGERSLSNTSDCRVGKIEFSCQVNKNNRGCQKVVTCPSGKKLVGAKAACNLEFGTVSSNALQSIPLNLIKILTASDKVAEGSCHVGTNILKSGQKAIMGISGLPRVAVGCKEHDKNGGDCHIKGVLYCK